MAQLSDDCFAIGEETVTIEQALDRFRAQVAPVAEVETVPVADALGRVLAADVIAGVPLPPFANSAVDGYAVRQADVAGTGETRLQVVDHVLAGAQAHAALRAGQAARVFTGAPLPAGADTVYMQEDARADAGTVVLPAGLRRGANLRPAGEEIDQGARALPAGRRLKPQDLGLAAAIGLTELPVRRRVAIAIFSTGDELVQPGRPLPPAKIYDANRAMLVALCRQLGLAVTDLGVLKDDLATLAAALPRAAAEHDIVLTSGGVSMGEADYVKDAVARAGRLDIWRFAIKPGRPLSLGALGSAAFVGLPGNPVAVYVTFTQIVRPLIAALAGEPVRRPTPRPVRAGFAYRKKPQRTEFVRVHLAPGDDLIPVARKFRTDGAGIISSLTETDGLVELAADLTAVKEGDLLPFTSFAEMV
jgi:molybdopterin molybdotransferase